MVTVALISSFPDTVQFLDDNVDVSQFQMSTFSRIELKALQIRIKKRTHVIFCLPLKVMFIRFSYVFYDSFDTWEFFHQVEICILRPNITFHFPRSCVNRFLIHVNLYII